MENNTDALYSEIFVDDEFDETMIEGFHSYDSVDFEPEDYDPKYYDELIFFDELTRYGKIKYKDCNLATLKKMINFIVERFKENGVYIDVVFVDNRNGGSSKHNRKVQDDIKKIQELIEQGLNNSQIERLTGITRKTVAKYRSQYKQK